MWAYGHLFCTKDFDDGHDLGGSPQVKECRISPLGSKEFIRRRAHRNLLDTFEWGQTEFVSERNCMLKLRAKRRFLQQNIHKVFHSKFNEKPFVKGN